MDNRGKDRPSGIRSIPPPPPSARKAVEQPPWPHFQYPPDTTVRELSCWSSHGCAGEVLSDAYAARAALAAKCRYGLNRFGRLIFVFLPEYGRLEHEIQSCSPRMTRPTLVDKMMTDILKERSRKGG